MTRNARLLRLPPDALAALAPEFRIIELERDAVMQEQGRPIDTVYFMETGVGSVVTVLEDGGIIETGTVGNEGIVGVAAALGTRTATERVFAQVPGRATALPVDALRRADGASIALRAEVLRYAAAFMSMLSQNAACNRMHPVEERLSRWLLMTADRVGGERLPLTQEYLAQMLGVGRPSVNIAASALQRAGFISYSRGDITVTDRAGLQSAACECYQRIRTIFARLDEPATV